MTPYGAVCWSSLGQRTVKCRLFGTKLLHELYPQFVCNWSLQWRHNERDCVSNHQPHDCLLKRLFSHRSKKTSKHIKAQRHWPLWGEFPAQKASNAENASIWWRHHVTGESTAICFQYQYLCTFYFVRGQHANDTTTKPLSCDLYTNSTDQQCLIMWSSGCSWFNGIAEGNMYCAVT